jgi:hypothetical protein
MDVSVLARIYDPTGPRLVRLTMHVPDTDDMLMQHSLSPEQLEAFLNESLLNDSVAAPPKMEESELELTAGRTRYRKRDEVTGSTCTVCLEDFRPRMYVRTLPCGHRFCSKCITKWVSRHNATCPTCREPLTQ